MQKSSLNGLIIKKASAGSGKTFNLALRYLHIILSSDQTDYYRRILAVTFTKEAAKEMKNRIINNLTGIALPQRRTDDTQTVLNMLTQITGETEEVLSSRSQKILQLLLQRYTDFSVNTLDSFSHRIVRSFSFDLNLASSFNVELETDAMINASISELLQEVGSDPTTTDVLSNFILDKIEDDKFKRPVALLQDFSRELLADYRHRYVKQLNKYNIDDLIRIKNHYKDQTKAAKKELIHIGQSLLDIVEKNGLNPEVYGRKIVTDYGQRLLNANAAFSEKITFQRNLSTGSWIKKTGSKADKMAAEPFEPEITALFSRVPKTYSDYITSKNIFNSLYQTITLKLMSKHVDYLKSSTQTLHISDFNKTIQDVVSREPAPFIYERLGEFYNHFLIDEFQDTSEVQWTNLVPLTGEALAKQGSLFIVGDAKQSIYRWRGGEVSQFVNLPQLPNPENSPAVAQWQTTFQNTLRENDNAGLETNRRSRENIIHFNNSFFNTLSESFLTDEYQKAYQDAAQKSLPQKSGGYVRFELYESDAEGDKMNAETGKPFIHAKIANLIKKLTTGKNAHYQGKDIFILCRTNSEIGEISADLKNAGISTFTDADIQLGQIPETALIAALIKTAFFPHEKYYRAQVLVNAGKLEYSFQNRSLSITRENLNLPAADFFKLFNLPDLSAKRTSAFDLFEMISRTVFGQNRDNPAVLAMGNEIHKFVTKHGDNPGGFLKQWDEKINEKSPDVSPHKDFVRIMTIHKSKGLQAPVIIMPNLTTPLNVDLKTATRWVKLPDEKNQKEALFTFMNLRAEISQTEWLSNYYQKEQEETMFDLVNHLYVGFTRAVDALYGFAYKQVKGGLHTFLNSLPEMEMTNDEIFEWGSKAYLNEVNMIEKKQETDSPPHFHFFDITEKLKSAPVDLPINRPGSKSKSALGSIIHFVLEHAASSNNIHELLNATKNRFNLNESDYKTVSDAVLELFMDEELKTLILAQDAFTERDLYDAGNQKILRPDKVVRTPKGFVLIDYKTGIAGEKAEKQLEDYADALERAGYPVAEKRLVFSKLNDL